MNKTGQMTIDGIIGIIILLVIYLIGVGYIFQPISNLLFPVVENTGDSYGGMATTILKVLMYIVVPLLLISTSVLLNRARVQQV